MRSPEHDGGDTGVPSSIPSAAGGLWDGCIPDPVGSPPPAKALCVCAESEFERLVRTLMPPGEA